MIRIGSATVSLARREVVVHGAAVPLGARAFDVLEALLVSANRVVSKQALLDAAWPDVIVEENNLAVQVHTLRKYLGLDRKVLETVPNKGYRLNLKTLDTPPGVLELTYVESLGLVSRVQGKHAMKCFIDALLSKVAEFESHNVRFQIDLPEHLVVP